MLRKELSLIINSLLVQCAAGIFIASALIRIIQAVPGKGDYASAAGMMVTGPVIMLSMAVSLFHLGNPFRAYRAVTNMWSSWLSREIFFTGAFLALWFVYLYIYLKGTNGNIVISLTAIAGVAAVISMAGIYYSTGKTGWCSINTYTGFLLSIVVFGCVTTSVLLTMYCKDIPVAASFINTAGIILAIVVIFKMVQFIILMPELKDDPDEWNIDSFCGGIIVRQQMGRVV